MKWMRRKRKPPTPEQREAMRAKVHADLQMRDAMDKQQDAVNIAATLREIRKNNHFGPSLEWTFGGHRP